MSQNFDITSLKFWWIEELKFEISKQGYGGNEIEELKFEISKQGYGGYEIQELKFEISKQGYGGMRSKS